MGKIADFPTVKMQIFEILFSEFKISMPLLTERCTVHGEETIPYFNAGVLSFSQGAMNTLIPKWIELNKELAGRIELLQDCKNFCEQASLSLAIALCKTNFLCLSNQYNFPAHCLSEPLDSAFANTDPYIIHYHWLVDEEGFLLSSPYPKVNQRIRAFNATLLKERNIS
jgi:lipopolysaccharide biosynthesis glycosyltransferase